MLTFWRSKRQGLCDGISRRHFLQVGSLGFGGLTLAHLLQLRAQEARTAGKRILTSKACRRGNVGAVIVTPDVRKFFGLLLKSNGPVLVRPFS